MSLTSDEQVTRGRQDLAETLDDDRMVVDQEH
jgi:hypothetical protein